MTSLYEMFCGMMKPENLMFYVFMAFLLFVGLFAGKGVKSVSEYALGNRMLGMGVLLLTLLATVEGGGNTIGAVERLYTHGIIYGFAALGNVFSLLLTALVIVPRMIPVKNELSGAEFMGNFYGRGARIFTGLIGALYCTVIFGTQLLAMSKAIQFVQGVDKLNSVLLAGSVMVAYTALGGIRAVAITDVMQFLVFIVVFPLFASLLLSSVGGFGNLLNKLSEKQHHLSVVNHPQLWFYVLLFFVGVSPGDPPEVQRMLMARSKAQLRKIYLINAAIALAFTVMVTLIGLCIAVICDAESIQGHSPLLVGIQKIFSGQPVLIGLILLGVVAVIMSTADSFLHSGSIFLVHDVIKPLSKFYKKPLHSDRELEFTKVATFLMGIGAMVLAYVSDDIINMLVGGVSLFVLSYTIPFFAGFMGMKTHVNCFLAAVPAAWISFLLSMWILGEVYEDLALLVGMVVSAVVYFSVHYQHYRRFAFVKRRWIERKEMSEYRIGWPMSAGDFACLIPTPRRILNYCKRSMQAYGSSHILLSSFLCINYIVPFFMWPLMEAAPYAMLALTVRLFSSVLCAGLLLEELWPKALKPFFAVYWYASLVYCLPFTATLMYCLQQGNGLSSVNLALAMILLAAMVDRLSFMFMSLLGILLSIATAGWALSLNLPSPVVFGYTLFFSALIGLVFLCRKARYSVEAMSPMRSVGRTLAHEISNVVGMNKSLAMRLSTVLKSTKANTVSGKQGVRVYFDERSYGLLLESVDFMEKINADSQHIIRGILKNLVFKLENFAFEYGSVADCVRSAVDKYGSGAEPVLHLEDDFRFYGSPENLSHVLYNLLWNSYKHGGSGTQVTITLKNKVLYFRDNGKGIPASRLPYIFNHFYTTDPTSIGMGLTYCRMVMEQLGGIISCRSVTDPGKGTYTLFKLVFPETRL